MTIDVVLDIGDICEVVTVRGEATRHDDASVSARSIAPPSSRGRRPAATFRHGSHDADGDVDRRFAVRAAAGSIEFVAHLDGPVGPRRDNGYVLDGVPIVDILNRATVHPELPGGRGDARPGQRLRRRHRTHVGRGVQHDEPIGIEPLARQRDVSGSAGVGAEPSSSPRTTADAETATTICTAAASAGRSCETGPFFWASTEGYRSATTRNTVLVLPTAAERHGDFSQTGITIYDPLTDARDPPVPDSFAIRFRATRFREPAQPGGAGAAAVSAAADIRHFAARGRGHRRRRRSADRQDHAPVE